MSIEIIIPARQTFELRRYEDEPLGPNEIRGRTLCTLVSQGTEMGWANGENFPVRPGYSAVFQVEAFGDTVVGIKPGELRFAMGPHRSTQTHDARFTLPVPAGMAPETAVIARLMGVSMTTLMTTRARPGDRVLVTGAGPVGFLAAHMFRNGGYSVTVVDPDPTRRAQAQASGLSDVRARVPPDDPQLAGDVSLVVDCSGHEGAVIEGCRLLRRLGEVVLVGVPWRKASEASAHDLAAAIFFNLVTVRSGWEWQLPLHERSFIWEELLEGYNNSAHSIFGGFSRALCWLDEGRIPLEGLVRVTRPVDPAQLYGDIASRGIVEPFIVLDWRSGD